MTPEESRSILAGYTAEKRRTLQELVDRAVRAARVSGYCDQFEHVMKAVLPEFVITGSTRYGERINRAFDTEDLSCRNETLASVMQGRDRTQLTYGPDGYNANDDRDRDGINRQGYDIEGRDADGWTQSQDRDGFYRTGYNSNSVYRLWADDGLDEPDAEARNSGWDRRARYVNLDRDGKPRIGRPADDVKDQPTVMFNPTTWAPEGETPIRGASDDGVESDYYADDDEPDDDEPDED